jgi:hypothetical protein
MSMALIELLGAERAASAKHDRFAATKDWCGLSVDVLGKLGWAVEAFAFAEHGTARDEFSMDKSALDVIATGAQLAILVKTIDTLKNSARSIARYASSKSRRRRTSAAISRSAPRRRRTTARPPSRSAPFTSRPTITAANSCSSPGAPRKSASGSRSPR